jgi:hypothetical protein
MKKIQAIRNNYGKVFFKTTIQIVSNVLQDLGIDAKEESQIVPFVFDPQDVAGFRPSSYEDSDILDKTCIVLRGSGEEFVIDCAFDTFETLFLSY